MSTLLQSLVDQILREAISSEFGITVDITVLSEDVVTPSLRAKQILYRFKKENPDFDAIQIKLSPTNPDLELWLIKTSVGQ